MPKWTFWLLPVAIVAAVLTGVFTSTDLGHASKPESSQSQIVWSHGHDGASANAEGHWQKHGREFPEFHSAQDYERGARNFISAPPAGTLTKHRDNGDTLFYNPTTNTFAVADRRNEPRTFFRPNNGRAYWDRQ
jgi:filamentous hemagglutinin